MRIGVLGPAFMHPYIFTIGATQVNQDHGSEHYSSFSGLKPSVRPQKALDWGSLPRLAPTYNFDTTKREFFRRSSWQAF